MTKRRDMARPLDIHTEQAQILERIVNAHQRLRARLLRVARLLKDAGIPYAVIGGNAVAVWVATRDESLVRATRDLDILVQPSDFERVKEALEADGFVYRHVSQMDMFLEGEGGKAGDAVHVLFAGRYVRPEDPSPTPEVSDAEVESSFSVLPLEDLVRTKLVAWRDKDRVHLRDLIASGLIDESWCSRYVEPLRSRLLELIENPE